MQDRLSNTAQRIITYINNGQGNEFETARTFLEEGLVQTAIQQLIDAGKLPEDAYLLGEDARLLRDRALLKHN